GLVERLRAGVHDRLDGEGSRLGRERRARAARARRGGAGGAAGAASRVVARPGPARLHERLRVLEALGGRSACVIGGPLRLPPNPRLLNWGTRTASPNP